MRKYYSEENNFVATFTNNYVIIDGKKYVRKECSEIINDALNLLEEHLKKHAIELCE
jgi:ribosomal protein S7